MTPKIGLIATIEKDLRVNMHGAYGLSIEKSGGLDGVRDMGLLDSVLQSAFVTFDGVELFPTTIEKAVRIGYGLVSNHAFLDGNKRIGVLFLLVYLEVNGVFISATNDEIVELGLGLAEGKIRYDELLDWVNTHKSAT